MRVIETAHPPILYIDMSKKKKKSDFKSGDFCWIYYNNPILGPGTALARVCEVDKDSGRITVWARGRIMVVNLDSVKPFGGENE